jgi:hypothetical protein
VIHTNLSQDLIPDTYFHVLQWEPTVEEQHQVLDVTGEVNVNKVRTFLGSLDWRNNMIVRDIKRDMKAGRKLLVLSHSVEHVNELGRHFRTRGAGIITGQTMQEDRMAILRECNPVFGTFQLPERASTSPPWTRCT